MADDCRALGRHVMTAGGTFERFIGRQLFHTSSRSDWCTHYTRWRSDREGHSWLGFARKNNIRDKMVATDGRASSCHLGADSAVRRGHFDEIANSGELGAGWYRYSLLIDSAASKPSLIFTPSIRLPLPLSAFLYPRLRAPLRTRFESSVKNSSGVARSRLVMDRVGSAVSG